MKQWKSYILISEKQSKSIVYIDKPTDFAMKPCPINPDKITTPKIYISAIDTIYLFIFKYLFIVHYVKLMEGENIIVTWKTLIFALNYERVLYISA